MGETDAEIIARTADEAEAFADIFDRYYTPIFRYAVARLGVTEGEEVAAQTFLVAFQKVDQYDSLRASARPWLFGIAANLVRQRLRQRERTARVHARLRSREVMAEHGDHLANLDLELVAPDLAAAMEELPQRERDVLLLFAWGELSYIEIAALLGIPIGTVRSRLHRARQMLRVRVAPSRQAQLG